MADSELTPTGRVILGMLALGKSTGYDIKQFVDKSTRHFWAASYGQIYPELRQLEEDGLVRGRPEPAGGRARTVCDLTDAGEAALGAWLDRSDEPLYELRDEGMLKLFFSDFAEPGRRVENIRLMRARQERKLAALRELEPHAANEPEGPYLTLQPGIGATQWLIEWCEAAERRLASEIHQGAGGRRGARRADRCLDHPGAAGAVTDGAAGLAQLVGPASAAPAARPDRATGGRPARRA